MFRLKHRTETRYNKFKKLTVSVGFFYAKHMMKHHEIC